MTARLRSMQLSAAARLPRHHHDHAYAAVVVAGAYEEAGESGRFFVSAGDVVIHPAFSAHCDRVSRRAAHVLDIPLPTAALGCGPLGRVADPERIVRLAQRDTREAAEALFEMLQPQQHTALELPDLLAAELNADAPRPIAAWAAQHGIARETLSRQFRALYEVSPARYRVEARARRAWHALMGSAAPLADIAQRAGYADQAHFSRDVRALSGRSPGAWRRSHSFKTSLGGASKLHT